MKKADYMIVGIALMLALVSFGVYRLYFASTGRAAIVEITVDGNVYKTLSLKGRCDGGCAVGWRPHEHSADKRWESFHEKGRLSGQDLCTS